MYLNALLFVCCLVGYVYMHTEMKLHVTLFGNLACHTQVERTRC